MRLLSEGAEASLHVGEERLDPSLLVEFPEERLRLPPVPEDHVSPGGASTAQHRGVRFGLDERLAPRSSTHCTLSLER